MNTNRKPKTLRSTIVNAVFTATTVTAGLIGGYAATAAVNPAALQFVEPVGPAAVAPVDPAADLIAEHDCWTQGGPEGVIPGHVVVTMDGQPTLGGSKMTGKALAQLFDGADHGLTIHAFCR